MSEYSERFSQPELSAEDVRVLDFAMMIRRLVDRLQKFDPDSRLPTQALALLEKYGIKSSPLR